MAMINTKNVHRSNALRGHPWGRDFAYDERCSPARPVAGRLMAELLAGGTRLQNLLLGLAAHAGLLISRLALPQPGQGPSQHQRESGSYDLLFTGQTLDGRSLTATVHGDRDPGYGSTSRMLTEAALCLAAGRAAPVHARRRVDARCGHGPGAGAPSAGAGGAGMLNAALSPA
jgi:short subunit dehydrogenase-like uncharacterized protein